MLAFLKDENIRVNCLCPDWVATPEVQAYVDSIAPESHGEHAIPAKLTTMEQIADAVVTLARDESLAGRVMVREQSRTKTRRSSFHSATAAT